MSQQNASENTRHNPMRVSIAMIEHRGDLLMLQRKDDHPMWDKKWEFPGGKIEPGESPEEAAQREVREETGIQLHTVLWIGRFAHAWELPAGRQLHVQIDVCRGRTDSQVVDLDHNCAHTYVWCAPHEIFSYDTLKGNCELVRRFYARELP